MNHSRCNPFHSRASETLLRHGHRGGQHHPHHSPSTTGEIEAALAKVFDQFGEAPADTPFTFEPEECEGRCQPF